MTLLQRISRGFKNLFLFRFGGRRRGINILFFTVFFITFTFYITERKSHSVQNLDDIPKLIERKAHAFVELTSTAIEVRRSTENVLSTSTTTTTTTSRKSDITRAIPAAVEEEVDNDIFEEKKTNQSPSKPLEGGLGKIPIEEKKALKNCTKHSPKLMGDMNSNPNITPSMEEVAKYVGPDVGMGGCFSPSKCKALQKVAIIIPFKDRDAHLKTLLYYLHPMLMRQRLHYCIYVAEQYDNGQFNKANVMNAAFEEALKLDDYDCIIFHDVDMIPENDKNFYMCGDQPRHLSPAIDKFQYKPHYGTDFGGVTGISPSQYRKANGHSNRFWGWGGEDNDMEYRIRYRNMSIIPSSLKIGRYRMIPHLHPWKFSPNKFPWKLNNTRKIRAESDGLSDLQYKLVDTIRHPMYTKLMIDIRRIKVTKLTLYIDGKSAMDIDLFPGECHYEEFPGKYLDFVIELTNKKEAQNLPLWPQLNNDNGKSPLLKDNLIGPDGQKRRFSMLHDLKQAEDLCDKLVPECAGVQRENAQENYSLRRGAMPRHLVISGPAVPRPPTVPPENNKDNIVPAEMRRYILPEKKAFMRYCPGEYSHFKPYKKPFLCTKENKCPHTYAFDVHFILLMNPADYVYYTDDKHFESHLEKGENHYTFTWPGGKTPNFSEPNVTTKYSFRTPDFAIPNIPGTYAVESRIVDKYRQPYFQWNWWFEVTSGDRTTDAKTRDAYWKKKMTENVLKGKAQQHEEMMRQKALRAKQNQQEYDKKMQELKKKQPNPPNPPKVPEEKEPGKPQPPKVPGKPDPRYGIPPKIAKVLEKVQNAIDKKESEGDPFAEFIDKNDPIFQENVGEIKISQDESESGPKPSTSTTSTTTTTTTTTLHRISPVNAKFHLNPPQKG